MSSVACDYFVVTWKQEAKLLLIFSLERPFLGRWGDSGGGLCTLHRSDIALGVGVSC